MLGGDEGRNHVENCFFAGVDMTRKVEDGFIVAAIIPDFLATAASR